MLILWAWLSYLGSSLVDLAGTGHAPENPGQKPQGWPDPYIYTVYDRIFGNFAAENTVYTWL